MRTTVDLSPAVHQRALDLAHRQHRSLSAVVAELTMRGLAQVDDPVPDSISYASLDTSVLGHREVTDAYPVGLAMGNDQLLVTFDRALAEKYSSASLSLR